MPPGEVTVVHTSFAAKIASHPYIALATVVTLVLALGGAIVGMRSGVTPQGTNTWSAAAGIFSPGSRVGATTNHTSTLPNGPQELETIPLPRSSEEEEAAAATELADLLKLLSTPAAPTPGSEGEGAASAYSFIPTGLISVETPSKRTAQEQALYEYGNQLGTEIQAFESNYRDAPLILNTHALARTDARNIAEVKALGLAYAELGVRIRELNSIPAEAASFNDAYGNGYRILGTNMTKIASATTDEEYIAAVNTYNDGVANLTKRFLAIVTFFGANNITFASSDAGSVFMFSGTVGF
jgi:hypothetical protein